jgi:hypothetical protein
MRKEYRENELGFANPLIVSILMFISPKKLSRFTPFFNQ